MPMLYFMDIQAVKRELIEGERRDGWVFPYVMGFTILFVLGGIIEAIPRSTPSNNTVSDLIAQIVVAVITLWGIYTAYLKNGGSEGSFFLYRLVPIYWVCIWRLLVFVGLPMLILAMVSIITEAGTAYLEGPIVELVLAFAITSFFYSRVITHMSDVAKSVQKS